MTLQSIETFYSCHTGTTIIHTIKNTIISALKPVGASVSLSKISVQLALICRPVLDVTYSPFSLLNSLNSFDEKFQSKSFHFASAKILVSKWSEFFTTHVSDIWGSICHLLCGQVCKGKARKAISRIQTSLSSSLCYHLFFGRYSCLQKRILQSWVHHYTYMWMVFASLGDIMVFNQNSQVCNIISLMII